MDKEKALTLHDYFSREIKPLLNPGGRNRPSAIATKITSVLTNSKRHKWGIEEDVNAIREIVYQKITKYNDEELTMWYSDTKAFHEEDTEKIVNKIISFYIEKNSLPPEEKAFYKEFQSQNY